jgi:prepilin-type N-terminal cleavage/methylation domain-containing protein
MWARYKKETGFTIVELLIVIVVIAILAAISIIAYNGIQDRAKTTNIKSDLNSLNKAIQLYYADNGLYPITGPSTWMGYNSAINNSFIPGIAPKYIQNTPQVGLTSPYPTFIYRSDNGQDYKLIYIVDSSSTLTSAMLSGNSLIDPSRPTRAFGYWSTGGESY